MKSSLSRLVIIATVLANSGQSSGSDLFHNGGRGTCQGCHTTPPQLIGSDAGSTCLICHQAPAGIVLPTKFYVATDTRSYTFCVQLPQAGDFCWLKKNYTWSSTGKQYFGQESSPGERHGHNIVALDYGYEPDHSQPFAPGGTYLSSSLTCISCHDPHGRYRRLSDGTISTVGPDIIASGSYSNSPDPDQMVSVGTYRLLAGKGYQPKTLPGVPVFTTDPPAAVAPTITNRAETTSDTRIAYGKGMSEWCKNCHPYLTNAHPHPVGSQARFSPAVAAIYNKYIRSGNLLGRSDTAYSSLVPFELMTNDYAILKRVANADSSNRTGPVGNANVMCLTCHRAHASGWDSMLRWNMQTEFIVYSGLYPGTDKGIPPEYAQGLLSLETQKTFYDRPSTAYAPYQRSLCNKCHNKD